MKVLEVQINTNDELLAFIQRDEVPKDLVREVIQKFLKVIIVFDASKGDLIEATKSHLEKFGSIPAHWEHPLFLNQKELDFNIKDIFNTNA